MGTKAQPTNNASSRRPNLLRSGVDGRVISAQVKANQTYSCRSPAPSKCYAPHDIDYAPVI